MNNLALMVDIGNTYISFGFFKNGILDLRLDVPSSIMGVADIRKPLKEFKEKHHINEKDIIGGLISSVVPSFTHGVQRGIFEVFNINIPKMNHTFFKDLKIQVDNPKEVGGDLVCDVVAANKKYGYPSLIFDLGTISKVMVVDKNGVFIGTSFFIGVQGTIEAMREKTALLPAVELKNKPKKLLGNNTLEALESGVFYGTLSMVEEYSRKIEQEIGYPLKKILTGGNAQLFKETIRDFIIDENLVLEGLYYIYCEN